MANAPILIPDAVYSALSAYAQGASARETHNMMPDGWKARLTTGSGGIEVLGPDGKIHFIPNGNF